MAADDARDRILAACARVIARDGLRRFRMQEVASVAGVSIGLLSYHFGDRDGLLQAALDRVNANAEARAGAVTAGVADPGAADHPSHSAATRLYALLAAEFGEESGIREGSIAWNELRAAAVFEPARAAAVARSTAAWQEAVRALVREADPGRSVRESETAALILTALVEGLSGRWLTGQIAVGDAQAALHETIDRLGFVGLVD